MYATATQLVYRAHERLDLTSEPDWAELKADVQSWRRADRARGTPLEIYARFTESCTDRGERGDHDLPRALAFFLPSHVEPPTGEEWAELCAAARSPIGPNPYDLAVAWAGGWRPGPAVRERGSRPVGELAVLAVIEQVTASLHATIRMLELQTGLVTVERDEIGSVAAAMGMSLLGACDCDHHVRGCRGTCGRGCCYGDHDLRNWDPRHCHLRPFIDQAVRGSAQRRIIGGAFATSMLYRTLEAEGRLLCRTVEWGRCDVCGRSFEGTTCPAAHPRTAATVLREPRKNQIIVPARSSGSGHVPIQRWWCLNCHHLYGAAGERSAPVAPCPRCGAISKNSKAVWTLAPAAPMPLAM